MIDLEKIIPILTREVATYQVPIVDLIAVQTRDPFKVLVATMLSARTKDEVTARAAERLFAKAPDLAALARLPEEEIAALIYPVGFFRNKARYLAQLSGVLREQFQGRIPEEVDELTRLPGVGRKTANLVVTVAFDKPAICVDTHVHRIMNIWGYVKTTTPLQTEMALREKLPLVYWRGINSILVAFGQGTCRPLWPHCDCCVIRDDCPRLGVIPRKTGKEKTMKKQSSTIRMVSWNVNGLRAVEKKGFVGIVAELALDILALQEIKATPEQISEEIKNIPGYTSYWFPARRKGYAGVAIYSRLPPLAVLYGMDEEEFDSEGRVLTLEFNDFFLVNAYFPNAQPGLKRIEYKLAFNRCLLQFLTRLAEKKGVVLGGDFNVAHKPIDLTNPKANEMNPGFSAPERAWMDEFTEGASYVDTFRKFNQEPGQYSWWSYRFNARARNIGWRIDYFCVDRASADRVEAAAIHQAIPGSDHCPVSLDFRVEQAQEAPSGYLPE